MLNISLSGKVAVITGSSRGIGRAIALLYAKAGASVVVSSRTLADCQKVVDEIQAEGGQAVAVACDITSKPDCEKLVARANETFGKVDIFVGNAAINPHYGPMMTVSDETYDSVMNANVRSNLWFTQLVCEQMKARKDGSIIFISSGAGFFGNATLGLYALSKAAEMQLARNFAIELAPFNVRTNVIAPGLIDTDFAKPVFAIPEYAAAIMASIPLGRIGTPNEVAGMAVLLASDYGRYISGQTLVVDGGIAISKA